MILNNIIKEDIFLKKNLFENIEKTASQKKGLSPIGINGTKKRKEKKFRPKKEKKGAESTGLEKELRPMIRVATNEKVK